MNYTSEHHIAISIGNIIDDLVDSQDLNENELAKKLCLSTEEYKKLKDGVRRVNINIAKNLWEFTGLSISFWVNFDKLFIKNLQEVNQENLGI